MVGIRGSVGIGIAIGLSAAITGLSPKLNAAVFTSSQTPRPSLQVAQASSISNNEILREINRLRNDPASYADWLETVRQYYNGTMLAWPGESPVATSEGTAALDEVIQALRQTPARPPLVLSSGMSNAASDHIQDLLQHNQFGPEGSDGSTSEDRIQRHGIYEGAFQELLSQGLTKPAAIVAYLVIDDGNPSREYRQALLQDEFRYAGIHCEPIGEFALCATNFAVSYTDAATAEDTALEPLTPEMLSNLAIAIVAETNEVRTDPVGYASKLEALRPYYQGTIVRLPGQPPIKTEEGISALDEAIANLKSRTPVSALEMSSGMSLGAADHARDIGPQGLGGHYGQDGSSPEERIERYGTLPPGTLVGENISFGPPASAEWHVIQLIVDDGVPNRSHRDTMLEPEYQLTGSACAPHTVFRIVCVITHAGAYVE